MQCPISCKGPALSKCSNDCRYCEADKDSKDNLDTETNVLVGKDTTVQRQNGSLGEVDGSKVKDSNGKNVFAASSYYLGVCLLQIGHVVTNPPPWTDPLRH